MLHVDRSFVPRLSDFEKEPPGCRRLLHCFSCSALVRMPIHDLIALHGSDALIPDVLKTIICETCGEASMRATMFKSYLAAPKSRQGPTAWLHKGQGLDRVVPPKP